MIKKSLDSQEKANYLHIITTKKIIMRQVDWFSLEIDRGLVYCIINGGINDTDYIRTLYSVCWRLHMIARLVYKGKNGICKLPENTYKKILFEYHMESLEEVADIIKMLEIERTETITKYVFNCLRRMEELIVHPIANVKEIIYMDELADMINYVIKKSGNIPRPEYSSCFSLFPTNYEDFKYGEGFSDFGIGGR